MTIAPLLTIQILHTKTRIYHFSWQIWQISEAVDSYDPDLAIKVTLLASILGHLPLAIIRQTCSSDNNKG